jgi:nucleotide-binding universal stress UspA family protein
MSSRALVPLDGSLDAAAALAPARALADETDADLILIRVVESDLSVPGDAQTAEASTYLATVGADVAASGHRVALVVAQGDPAAEVVHEARAADVNMIVMAAHAEAEPACSGERRGVADRIARAAPCPVLLFRGDHDGTYRLLEAALDRPSPLAAGVDADLPPQRRSAFRITTESSSSCSSAPSVGGM